MNRWDVSWRDLTLFFLTLFFLFFWITNLLLEFESTIHSLRSKGPTKQVPLIEDGGEGGIRTLGTLLTYTHFPGVLLKPLGHLSGY